MLNKARNRMIQWVKNVDSQKFLYYQELFEASVIIFSLAMLALNIHEMNVYYEDAKSTSINIFIYGMIIGYMVGKWVERDRK